MLGSYINNSYNRISEQEKQAAFAKNPIRPNEDLETYFARTGAQYESDRNRSAEQKRIAMDPNKSKGLDELTKGSWLSETAYQQKYGPFNYSPMGGGGEGGGNRETPRRAPQGVATYNPGKSEDMRNSVFAQWKTDAAKKRGTGGRNW